MGQTIAEKVFTRASGGKSVKAGDFVTAKIDLHYNLETGLAEVHNRIIESGLLEGLPKIVDPEITAIILGDHRGCHAKPQEAAAYKLCRELIKRYGIKKFYDINTGIAHVAVAEEGLVRPGMLVCGKDSYATTCGAVNALATPVSIVQDRFNILKKLLCSYPE